MKGKMCVRKDEIQMRRPRLTFRDRARPPASFLARNYGLALHHKFWVTIELDYVSSFVNTMTLNVAVLGCVRRFALHLCNI
jgi:hypothetical protein